MRPRVVSTYKSSYKWMRRLFFVILTGFCVGSLLSMHTRHNRVRIISSLPFSSFQRPKIAFLFIARNRIPLEMVWDAFFQGEKENKFSIFVHSRPGFVFNNATTRSTYFLNRQLSDSVQVDWGEATMIQAERILLKHALIDPFNERFVFLSESCIPLYNFSYTYNYIMSNSNSFVDSFSDTKESRYNPKMNPVIPVNIWRKGSQWAVLTRKHAKVVVKDNTVFLMFQRHCKRKPLPEYWRNRHIQKGLAGEITRRSLTHTSWNRLSSKNPQRRGWHPVTYKYSDATPMVIQAIKVHLQAYN